MNGAVSGTLTIADDALNVSGATQQVQLSVAVPAQLQLNASSPSLHIVAGQVGTLQLNLSASGTLTSPVSFSCSGLPIGAACTFSPPLVASVPATVVVAINTARNTAAIHRRDGMRSLGALAMSAPALLLMCSGSSQTRRRLVKRRLAVLLVVPFVGCGGPSNTAMSTQQSSYTVTVAATAAGAASGTTNIQVTIAP
jgi:hypothetical protein